MINSLVIFLMENFYIILFIIVIGVIIQIIDIFQALINKKWIREDKLSALFKLISTIIVTFLCIYGYFWIKVLTGEDPHYAGVLISTFVLGVLLTIAMLIWSFVVIINYITKLFVMIKNK